MTANRGRCSGRYRAAPLYSDHQAKQQGGDLPGHFSHATIYSLHSCSLARCVGGCAFAAVVFCSAAEARLAIRVDLLHQLAKAARASLPPWIHQIHTLDICQKVRVKNMFERDFANSRMVEQGELDAQPIWFKFAVRVARLLAPIQ